MSLRRGGPRSAPVPVSVWFLAAPDDLCRAFGSADDRDAVGVEDHAGGGLVGARQVVEVFAVGVAAGVGHLLVLLHADHQALVTDGLDVVLVAVGGLVEGALWRRGGGEKPSGSMWRQR